MAERLGNRASHLKVASSIPGSAKYVHSTFVHPNVFVLLFERSSWASRTGNLDVVHTFAVGKGVVLEEGGGGLGGRTRMDPRRREAKIGTQEPKHDG